MNYKGTIYEGEHEAIVEEALWRDVQKSLRRNGNTGGRGVRNKYGALLKGLLYCIPCQTAMTHTHTAKDNKRYRYYVCTRAQKEGWDKCPTKSLPAGEIEGFVVDRIRCIGKDFGLIAGAIEQAHIQYKKQTGELERERRILEKELRSYHEKVRRLVSSPAGKDNTSIADQLADLQERIRATEKRATSIQGQLAAQRDRQIDEQELKAALSPFDPVWETLAPREKARIVRLLVERVGYDGAEETVAVTFRPSGIKALAGEAQISG